MTYSCPLAESYSTQHEWHAQFPSIAPTEWCGEWQPAQPKIENVESQIKTAAVDCIGNCGRKTRSKEQLCLNCAAEAKG